MQDFKALTLRLREQGYFEPNKSFFLFMYLHVLALEVLAWYLVAFHHAHKWGSPLFEGSPIGWIGTIVLALILGLANAQGAWLQHDAGHKSIYGANESCNFWAQQLTMGVLCGASANWWKDRHSRHHAKTNIYEKDPDIRGRGIVLFGDVQFLYPTEFIVKPIIPYQAFTFVFAAVPSVMTWLFVRPILWHILKNGNFYDALFASTFYIRNYFLYYPYIGSLQGLFQMYLGLRLVQSIIFTWVTQISHIPMEIILDRPPSPEFCWVKMQLQGTLNVAGGWFNDWFTGHLNYQIEHHLWPQMPRHSYPHVAPMVQELCLKHDIDYVVLPNLFTGCVDVVKKIQQTAHRFVEYQQTQKLNDKKHL
jgi:acyl-CoA 6-desaturase (Delta-6 desaturase)